MSLPFGVLKRLSFTHSAIYAALLTVWLVPGLAGAELVLGFAHGIGWIVMVALSLAALRARVVSLRLAFAVAVLGALAPFFGSWQFVREQRRRDSGSAPVAGGAAPRARPGRVY